MGEAEWFARGQRYGFHPPERCAGEFCVFHNPSDHRMVSWPTNIRASALTERMCPHGVGHPDPDSVAWLNRVTGQSSWGVHGCDGCCHE